MGKNLKVFEEPIYITRPLLPDLNKLTERLGQIWDTKWLTNAGHQHNTLEERLRQVLGVPQLSLFNNGTIALMTACKSLGISGEVITTPFTFAATPHVLAYSGLSPVFCDIATESMTIDPLKIEAAITSDTSAILAVHVYGIPCNVQKIQEIADKHNLRVIYDAAHAFQTEIDGVGIGNYGDITMYSFHATKLFHTAEGGALAFRTKEMKDAANLYKNFGIKNEETVLLPGINGKMNEIQAAIGHTVLDMVEYERNKRKALSDAYFRGLKGVKGITLMNIADNVRNSYQYFVIRIDENGFGQSRDYVYEELKKYNVFTRKYFYPLCSNYDCYRHLPSASIDNLPVANKTSKEVLSLPFYGELAIEDVECICSLIRDMNS